MAKKSKRGSFFLETSGVIYELHGHSLMQAAVREAVGEGLVQVSNFIRMEYLRGFILNLIELYFLIKESESVDDALIDWSQKVNQERKLKVALLTVSRWMVAHEDRQAREKSLRRLGDLIVRSVYDFDETYRSRAKDRLTCKLGRVRFPRSTFSEDMLLRFYDRFRSIQAGPPGCGLCDFRDKQQRLLQKKRIDLYSQAQRDTFSSFNGYVKQAERLEEAAQITERVANCRWCERLGDSIIILQAPPQTILVTADRAFEAFGQILNREIRRLSSLAELKRRLSQQANSDETG